MPTLGETITLYLLEGTATGRWQAKLSNWNGVAYKLPHKTLKECENLPDLHLPGVYFLFGKDDNTDKPFVYVGEGDDVLKRLLQPHTFEKDGSYWMEGVVFVTPDGTLEKGRVKYLENRFYTLAKATKRYDVKNANTPPQSPMPKPVQDLLERFIINVCLVMPALGFKVLEPSPSNDWDKKGQEADLLYFSRNDGKGGQGTGKIEGDEFWVLKGSYIYPELADYFKASNKGTKAEREKYAAVIGKDHILQDDASFSSPSSAAAFICGKSSNGLVEWKNKAGQSLKDLESGAEGSLAITEASPAVATEGGSVQPVISPASAPQKAFTPKGERLHFAGKKIKATGQLCTEGFVVFQGSCFSHTETDSCPIGIRKQRADLVKEGKLAQGLFVQDVLFNSPSAAAACVSGGSANGNILWVDAQGKTLKELLPS